MSKTKSYEKLIRDKIPQIMEAEGKTFQISQLSGPDFYKFLYLKLQEEVNEFFETGSIEELADILEVIYTIARQEKATPEELEEMRRRKYISKGGFEEKLLLTVVAE